jgi:hypothetical protein
LWRAAQAETHERSEQQLGTGSWQLPYTDAQVEPEIHKPALAEADSCELIAESYSRSRKLQ